MPDFCDDPPPYPFMHEFQIALAEVETPIESEEQVQSDPFVFHDQPRVVLIKTNEAVAQWHVPVSDQLLPFRFPVTQEHLAVYAFDDRILAWKVPIKQCLSNARAHGQFACLASESVFGKECSGSFDNRLRSLFPRHAVGSPPNCVEAAFHRLARLSW